MTTLIIRSWAWREWSVDSSTVLCTTHGQKHPDESMPSEICTDRDISAARNMHQAKTWWDCSPHSLEVKQELESCDSKGSTANRIGEYYNDRSNQYSALSMHQAGFEAFYGYCLFNLQSLWSRYPYPHITGSKWCRPGTLVKPVRLTLFS